MTTLENIADWVETADEEIERLAISTRRFVEQRRWKGEELTKLVRINSIQRIYDAEREGKLPPSDRDERGRRLGYTLEQALEAMRHFNTTPGRKNDDPPVVLSFTNFKGGCWKTTSTHYFTTWAASQGYRVLAIDLDPQASLTRNLGLMPDMETSYEDTLAAVVSGDVPLTKEAVRSVIRDTHLPTLHFIPSSLDLQAVEWLLSRTAIDAANAGDMDTNLDAFLRLRRAINLVVDDYDIVVMDGTPTLGLIPLNIILASDSVIVPVPTEIADYCSTISFLRMLGNHMRSLTDTFGADLIQVPNMLFLPTRFAPGPNTTMGSEHVVKMIKKAFGDRMITTVIRKHDSAISNLSLMCRTVFDTSPGEGGVKTEVRKRAAANFSHAFDEILRRAVLPHWPNRLEELTLTEVVNG